MKRPTTRAAWGRQQLDGTGPIRPSRPYVMGTTVREARAERLADAVEAWLAAPCEGARCTSQRSCDGGSGGPMVPCRGTVRAGLVEDGCGEPCDFVMHPPGMSEEDRRADLVRRILEVLP